MEKIEEWWEKIICISLPVLKYHNSMLTEKVDQTILRDSAQDLKLGN